MTEPIGKDSNETKQEPNKKCKSDFDFLRPIGEGSFSTVYLAKDKRTQILFAIKECDKHQILKEKKVKYVHLEKRILSEFLNNHPFFVKLCFTFQDDDSLYFGLSYCSNGDLLDNIKKSNSFSLAKSQFYSAEIVDALQYMHDKKIVHRDLKPENILLDEKNHIKLTDFGTARILEDCLSASNNQMSSNQNNEPETTRRRNSFVGTAQFVSPEILQGKSPHIGTDLWAFGCIVYQMLTGKHLFTGNHEYDIFQKIIKLSFTFPENFEPSSRSLVEKLVVTEPNERLGVQGYQQLKAHEFFKEINWQSLENQTPPS